MNSVENTLYGKTYFDDSLNTRLNRAERSLFGATQPGNHQSRLAKINDRIKQQKVPQSATAQEPMVAYLEQKLLQKTYPELSLDQRLNQLETHVFSRSFEKYPLDIRIKKLTYTIPLSAKEVRLSKQDKVIATTARKPKPLAQQTIATSASTIAAVVPTTSLKAEAMGNGIHYYEKIFRLPNDKTLRWMSLPVKVYCEGGTKEESDLTGQAVNQWNNIFPIQTTTQSGEADILVNWKTVDISNGPTTQPIIYRDSQKNLRTIILVNLGLYRNMSTHVRLHAILHQLGHASGLWGHSEDANDIMYPISRLEYKDIPDKWNTAMALPTSHSGAAIPIKPSSRDRNTLLQIYDRPGQDMKTFSPIFFPGNQRTSYSYLFIEE